MTEEVRNNIIFDVDDLWLGTPKRTDVLSEEAEKIMAEHDQVPRWRRFKRARLWRFWMSYVAEIQRNEQARIRKGIR